MLWMSNTDEGLTALSEALAFDTHMQHLLRVYDLKGSGTPTHIDDEIKLQFRQVCAQARNLPCSSSFDHDDPNTYVVLV